MIIEPGESGRSQAVQDSKHAASRGFGGYVDLATKTLTDWGLWLLSSLHRAGMDKDIRWTRQFAARLARVLVLAGMSFPVNQIPVRASALTYTTILSFIPFAVILSSVAGSFGYLDILSRLVVYLGASMDLDINLGPVLGAIEYAQSVNFQRLGLVGSLGLLFVFYLSMNNLELAMDHIWDVRQDRSWWGQLKVYTPFLLLVILLIVIAGNVLARYRVFLDLRFSGEAMPILAHETVLALSLAGIIAFVWVALVMLFTIIPNTRVRLGPAVLAASLCTGAFYLLGSVLALFPGFFLSRNNFLYGSLAVFPLVLLLLYLVWTIILYGAAVAFIYQRLYHSREKTSILDPGDSDAFHRMEKEVLDVLKAVYALSGSKAMRGRLAVPLDMLTGELWDDAATIEELAAPLVDLGILAKRKIRSGPVYAPRKSLEEVDLTGIHNLLLRLDPRGVGKLSSLTAWDEAKHTLGVLYSSGKQSPPLYLGTVLTIRDGAD